MPTAQLAAPPSPPTDPEDHVLAKEPYSYHFDMSLFTISDDEDVDVPKAAEKIAKPSSATAPLPSPKLAEVLQELSFMRPVADIVAETKLPLAISSVLGEIAEEDRPALGKLGSLQ
jgi:hypothetical protein